MRNLFLAALEDASRPYLQALMAQTPREKHAVVLGQAQQHRDRLADFCLDAYPGAGALTSDFICALHRALFPGERPQELLSDDGRPMHMVPGTYKSFSNNSHQSSLTPGQLTAFISPDQVPLAMEKIVDILNTKLTDAATDAQKTETIGSFLIDFLAIHPFMDGNGRVACILADLLALRAGLPAFHFHTIKTNDRHALYSAIEAVQRNRDVSLARAMLARYGR